MTGAVSKRGMRTGCAFSGGSGGTPFGAAFAAAVATGAAAGEAAGAGEADATGVGVGAGVGDAAFATRGVGLAAGVCALTQGMQARTTAHSSATLLMMFMGSFRFGRTGRCTHLGPHTLRVLRACGAEATGTPHRFYVEVRDRFGGVN